MYKLSSKENDRLCSIASWLNCPKDLYFRAIIKKALDDGEAVKEMSNLTQDLHEKYKYVESIALLDL